MDRLQLDHLNCSAANHGREAILVAGRPGEDAGRDNAQDSVVAERCGSHKKRFTFARGKVNNCWARIGPTMKSIAELVETLKLAPVQKRAMTNLGVLNEAYDYARPSSFSRGMRIDLNGVTILLISGTASIDERGNSVHIGDIRAQMQRTFQNLAGLLASEGASWHDIVRTTCYLRDIDRDYEAFNEERTKYFTELGLNPLPASTCIQAHLCRPELLVEIEAIAMFQVENPTAAKA